VSGRVRWPDGDHDDESYRQRSVKSSFAAELISDVTGQVIPGAYLSVGLLAGLHKVTGGFG